MASSAFGPFIVGQQAVGAAGTAEQLDTANAAVVLRALTIIAYSSNTGRIFYGGSDVDSSTQKGLQAGESMTFEGPVPFELGSLWIDAATNNDGVDFIGVRA